MDRRQSEISYWVAPAFWNSGLASEAVRAIIAANPHGAAQVFAEVFQDNPGSARVLTNCDHCDVRRLVRRAARGRGRNG
jgi:RimJ/RimL family protein N-acetyltransferase